MKRDADGFPLSFELSVKDAEAWEREVERMRKEKLSTGQGGRRIKASAPSVMPKVANQKRKA